MIILKRDLRKHIIKVCDRPNVSLGVEYAENKNNIPQTVVFKRNPINTFNLEAEKIKSKINNYNSNYVFGDALMG